MVKMGIRKKYKLKQYRYNTKVILFTKKLLYKSMQSLHKSHILSLKIT